MPDARTIVDVTAPFADSGDESKKGELQVHLSDESTAFCAGFPEIKIGDHIAQIVELRDIMGNGTGDGPILTEEIKAKFIALGATVPDVTQPSAPEPATSNQLEQEEQPHSEDQSDINAAHAALAEGGDRISWESAKSDLGLVPAPSAPPAPTMHATVTIPQVDGSTLVVTHDSESNTLRVDPGPAAATVQASIRHAQTLRDFAYKIECGAEVFLHEIAAALHVVL